LTHCAVDTPFLPPYNPPMSPKDGITPQQRLFVHEYLIDLNGKQAAIRAGYSEKTAESQASRLLRKVKVKDSIEKALEKRTAKLDITAERVLQEFAKIGFSNMQDFAEWSPGGITLKDSLKLTPEQAACVAEISETTTQFGGSVRFKLHDKIAALEKLGRHLKLFTDVSEHKIDFAEEAEKIDEAEKKAAERLKSIKG